MDLVFVHGWGFTADFWDPLCALLPQFRHRRVDLGFYGDLSAPEIFNGQSILVGHSLGFMHGFMQKKDWSGWIAINGFPRFVHDNEQLGCVTASELREMKMALAADSAKTLRGFYRRIGAKAPHGAFDIERLRLGLDELRDGNVTLALESCNMSGLVLAARNDPLVPAATSAFLGSKARKGGVIWHETGGHILPLNDAAWCAQAIQEFLQNFLDG